MSRTGLIICLLGASPAMSQGQDPAPALDTTAAVTVQADSAVMPTVAEAVAARDSGNLAGAAAMLRQVLERQPTNGEAVRHLAQLLYWLKDVPGSTALYEKGIREHPEDFTLQLDYGRMLVETRADARATEVLTPLTSRQETAARASTLLGTMYYWRGNLTSASRLFRSALAIDSSLAEASKSLDEIRTLAAPWTTIRAGGLHDDQPIDRLDGEIEAGGFLTPALRVSARARHANFTIDEPGSPRATLLDAGFSHSTPGRRLETSASAGAVLRSFAASGNDWIGKASVRLGLPAFTAVAVRAERAPYYLTLASLADSVMVNSLTGLVALDHPRGWLGEAAYRVEHFSDNNDISTAYAWLLAPAAREEKVRVSVGYAFAYHDSDETRFHLRYDPYYTPENIVTHSAIGSVTLLPSKAVSITVRGGYGVVAHEDAPPLLNSPGAGFLMSAIAQSIEPGFTRREFSPWDAHASLSAALTNAVTVSAGVDAMKTAFYRATTANVSITYRFLPAPSR